MACQETTEACLECEEPTSVDMESEAGHREVPTEEAAAKSSGRMRKRYRDRLLAAGRCGRVWIPAEVDCRLQKGVPSCKSGMAQVRRRQKGLYQG
jgi:hypothetical protein